MTAPNDLRARATMALRQIADGFSTSAVSIVADLLEQVRDDALDEAAREADRVAFSAASNYPGFDGSLDAEYIARKIRALKRGGE